MTSDDLVNLLVTNISKTETGLLLKVSMVRPCLKSELDEGTKVMEYPGGVYIFGPVSRKINVIAPIAIAITKSELTKELLFYPYQVVFPSNVGEIQKATTNLQLYQKALNFLEEKAVYERS